MADKVNEYIDALMARWRGRIPVFVFDDLRLDFHGVARKMLELQREGYFTPAQDAVPVNPVPEMLKVQEQLLSEMRTFNTNQDAAWAADQNTAAERKKLEDVRRAEHYYEAAANAAMNGLLAANRQPRIDGDAVARAAYDMADTMRDERERRKGAE